MKKTIISFAFTRNYCLRSTYQIKAITNNLISQESFDKFQGALPKIIDNIFTECALSGISDIKKSVVDSLCSAKNLNGLLLLRTYETLKTLENMTENSFHEACILAWAVEMFHYCYKKVENFQDGAKPRLKKEHLLPDIEANNIRNLVRSSIYVALYRNYGEISSLKNYMDLFNKAFLYKAIGECLDKKVSKAQKESCKVLTMEQYENIVYYKSTYGKINLPIYLATTLTNTLNDKNGQEINDICIDIGKLVQMEEDYLDCFGISEQVDYTGTDIEAGSCTWLAVTALQRCTTPQRIVFNTCYGSPEPAHRERIKGLYVNLKLPQIYKEQKKVMIKRVEERIECLSKGNGVLIPREVFSYLFMTDKHTL